MILETYKNILKEIGGCSTLIDIACGKGEYSLIAKELGYKVHAIDSRKTRVPLAEFKKRNITFEHIQLEDLKEIKHDVCLLSGIFYHLDLGQQLDLLSKIKSKYIILNTHILNYYSINEFNLKNITKTGMFEIAVYREGNNRTNRPMASQNNYFSIWHTEQSLNNIFQMNGFRNFENKGKVTNNRFFYKIW